MRLYLERLLGFRRRHLTRLRPEAVGATLVAWIFLAFTNQLEFLSYDIPSTLWPGKLVPAEALLIRLDDKGYSVLGGDPAKPLDRTHHAKLLQTALAASARTIVFDFRFDEPSLDPRIDETFARALSQKVILGVDITTQQLGGTVASTTNLPTATLLKTGARWGIVNLPEDTDHVIRRHHPSAQHIAEISVNADRSLPQRTTGNWLHYYGPPGRITSIDYAQALSYATNPVPAEFQGRFLFVGRVGSVLLARGSASDQYPTPFTRWNGQKMDGVELLATACLNRWHGASLHRGEVWVECLMLAVLGIGLAESLCRCDRQKGVRNMAILALSATIIVGLSIHWWMRCWFPWLIPCVAQIPFLLGWRLLAMRQREKDEIASPAVDALENDVETFDVLISYNRDEDTDPVVTEIVPALKSAGLSVWLDIERCDPGRLWVTEFGNAVPNCRAAAVFVGQNFTHWQNQEAIALLRAQEARDFPVIPVVLTEGGGSKLPHLLGNLTWIVYPAQKSAALAQLIRGIRGATRPRQGHQQKTPP
jgi:CHASE2 domain-containing sensor protein